MQAIPIRPGVFRFPLRFDGVGAMSGILALLISAAQVWIDVLREPETVAFNGSFVDLIYDPVQQQVTLQFPVVLRNGGSVDDVLKTMKANLNNKTAWDSRQIAVTENGLATVPRVTPFGLPVGASQLGFTLISVQHDVLAAGSNRIDLTLQTSKFALALGYCFDLTDAQINEMRQSARIWERTMTTVECHPQDGGGKSS